MQGTCHRTDIKIKYMRFIFIPCLWLLITLPAISQLTGSNLPIVIITPEATIADDYRYTGFHENNL